MESGCSSCQNQDLRDYGIFRILAERVLGWRARVRIRICGIFGYGEKRCWARRNPENPENPANPDSDGADLRAAPAWAILKSAKAGAKTSGG